jgi:hypothetical protein
MIMASSEPGLDDVRPPVTGLNRLLVCDLIADAEGDQTLALGDAT